MSKNGYFKCQQASKLAQYLQQRGLQFSREDKEVNESGKESCEQSYLWEKVSSTRFQYPCLSQGLRQKQNRQISNSETTQKRLEYTQNSFQYFQGKSELTVELDVEVRVCQSVSLQNLSQSHAFMFYFLRLTDGQSVEVVRFIWVVVGTHFVHEQIDFVPRLVVLHYLRSHNRKAKRHPPV